MSRITYVPDCCVGKLIILLIVILEAITTKSNSRTIFQTINCKRNITIERKSKLQYNIIVLYCNIIMIYIIIMTLEKYLTDLHTDFHFLHCRLYKYYVPINVIFFSLDWHLYFITRTWMIKKQNDNQPAL